MHELKSPNFQNDMQYSSSSTTNIAYPSDNFLNNFKEYLKKKKTVGRNFVLISLCSKRCI